MKTISKKLGFGILLAASAFFASIAQATPITQSFSGGSSSSYWYGNGWTWQQIGSVVLADGTNSVSSLTTSVTLVDQGWGGQDGNNGVKMGLFDGSTLLWYVSVAGSTHSWATVNYTADAATLTGLDTALAGVNWSANSGITLNMFTTPFAYPGWELHTNNDSFSVTSEAVPEPASLALLGLGLAGLAVSRRRRA